MAVAQQDVNNTENNTANGIAEETSEHRQDDKPKLKKIPSFSEKVVEAMVASQTAGICFSVPFSFFLSLSLNPLYRYASFFRQQSG